MTLVRHHTSRSGQSLMTSISRPEGQIDLKLMGYIDSLNFIKIENGHVNS